VILVYHKNNRISKVVSDGNRLLPFDKNALISNGLYQLAVQFPQSKLVWCNEELQDNLNLKAIGAVFYHNKMILSYRPGEVDFLGRKIGYVEESPFIKINKKVRYPTWQMSSIVGVVHASLLLEIKDKIKWDTDFDYYLNSVAKICMPLGLFCYSEPRLFRGLKIENTSKRASIYTLFRFVKQHYKTRWVFLLLLNLMLYEIKFPFSAIIYAVFFKNRNKNSINIETIIVNSSLQVVDQATVDVVIPTIGRSNYLYDVLCDLRKQTFLPKSIIIIEQNTSLKSDSELDYLRNEEWPFVIKHTFTHQPGACHARNIALGQTESEWVFLADDDIRIKNDFIQKVFENIQKFGVKSVSFSCLKNEEKQVYKNFFQWSSFGSGCSIVAKKSLIDCSFNMGFEFGYGEDSDFGMQLRNREVDVVYFPEPSILHLKAPMGGFRTKPILAWYKDEIVPKPSPTVMLFQILHNTQEQRLGYKTTLFFKYYKYQKIKNPMTYFINFKKQWNRSIFLANELSNK